MQFDLKAEKFHFQFGLWVYPRARQICLYSASRQIVLLPKQNGLSPGALAIANAVLARGLSVNRIGAWPARCFKHIGSISSSISDIEVINTPS